jgi:GTPase SAR1 family protein
LVVDPWVTIPSGALTAYKHRQEVKGIWNEITKRIRGRKSRLVVTGMPGVGKTVLFDHLTGKGFAPGYTLPSSSYNAEAGKVRQSGKRVYLTVVPGQASPQRTDSLVQALEGKEPVDGIVHVTCNGYVSLRSAEAGAALRESGLTLDEYRRRGLALEIEDFNETADAIRRSVWKHRNRPWVVVAVDKLDLFSSQPEMLEAHKHYGLTGGAFFEAVARLIRHVGSDNITCDVVPVCAWLEDFEWGDERVVSSLGENERRALVSQVLNMVLERVSR